METKLHVFSSGDIEMYQDVAISLNYSIAEIQRIEKTNSAFSKTITVPGTKNNNRLLGQIFDISVDDTFDVRVRARCSIDADGITQMTGDLRLVSIKRSKEEMIEYNLEVQGIVASIFNGMSEHKCNELELGEVVYLEQNIYDTWVSDPTVLNYAFPLVDQGNDSQHQIYHWFLMRPMLSARYVLSKIFAYAGFTWQSDFLDSSFFKHLFVGAITDSWGLTADELIQRRCRASVGSNQTISALHDVKTTIQINDDTTSPNTDPSGIFNTGTYTAVPLIAGNYQITGQFVVDIPSYLSNTYGYRVTISAYYEFPFMVPDIEADVCTVVLHDTGEAIMPFVYNIYAALYGTGTKLKFKARIVSIDSTAAAVPDFRIKNTSYIDLHTYASNHDLIGETVQLNKAFDKDLTMREFFTSIIKMFNLYVDVDPDNSNKLRIEPRNDFYSGGRTIDWSDKRDLDSELTITPSDIGVKEFNFKYAKDEDFWNKKYQSSYLREYADRTVTVNSDFLKEKNTTEISFAPTPCVQFMNSDRIVPAIYKEGSNGTISKTTCKTRILYYSGTKTCSPGFYTNSDFNNYSVPVGSLRTTYPHFNMIDDVANPTLSLDFGVPRKVYWDKATYTDNNLYNKYYKQFLEESVNIGSRIVEGKFYLTPSDIAGLNFRDTIHVDGINYRINKITDYDPVVTKLCNVELIKIVSEQTAEITTAPVYGGGGTPFTTPALSPAVLTNELVPVKTRLDATIQDGNTYYPEQTQRVSGQSNQISPSASFVSISGIGNFIGADARYVEVVNSSGTIIGAGVKNISVVNSSGVIVQDGLVNVHVVNSGVRTITESNIAIIGNNVFRTSSANADLQTYAARKSLTALQIKNMDSVPIDFGLPEPGAGYAYEVLSMSVKYTYGTVVFDFADFIALYVDTLTVAQFRTGIILDQANDNFVLADKLTLTSPQIIENKKIYLTASADSTTGDGTAIVYITYKILTL